MDFVLVQPTSRPWHPACRALAWSQASQVHAMIFCPSHPSRCTPQRFHLLQGGDLTAWLASRVGVIGPNERTTLVGTIIPKTPTKLHVSGRKWDVKTWTVEIHGICWLCQEPLTKLGTYHHLANSMVSHWFILYINMYIYIYVYVYICIYIYIYEGSIKNKKRCGQFEISLLILIPLSSFIWKVVKVHLHRILPQWHTIGEFPLPDSVPEMPQEHGDKSMGDWWLPAINEWMKQLWSVAKPHHSALSKWWGG